MTDMLNDILTDMLTDILTNSDSKWSLCGQCVSGPVLVTAGSAALVIL